MDTNSVDELVRESIALTREKGTHLWWRGQADIRPPLLPAAFRHARDFVYERNVLKRFRQRAPGVHSSCPSAEDHIGWLALAQHYGLPTRLLDWTESVLLAAFFAVEGSEAPHRDGVIWVLDPHRLNAEFWGKEVALDPDAEPAALIAAPFEEAGAAREQTVNDGVAAILVPHGHERLKAQLGAFTIHASHVPLQDYPTAASWLYQFRIPARVKPRFLEDLYAIGVRRSTIFPDLENVAKETASLSLFSD